MNKILKGDCIEQLKTLPDGIVQTCITSPPYYGLRDYGADGQIGLEETPELFVQRLVDVFREVRRVLKDDGTVWLNLGDSYFSDTKGTGGPSKKQDSNAGSRYEPIKLKRTNGLKPKDLIGIPWRVAFALQSDGWYLRQDIIWHKPNPMPESVTDRCTKAHEYIFLLSKSQKYFYDAEAIKEPAIRAGERPGGSKYSSKQAETNIGGKHTAATLHERAVGDNRNKRSVWTVNTKPYKEAHFAVFPDNLIKPCVLAGSAKGDIVLDPFFGSGTTGEVALRSGRQFIGCELNAEYIKIAEKRLHPYLTQKNLFNLHS